MELAAAGQRVQQLALEALGLLAPGPVRLLGQGDEGGARRPVARAAGLEQLVPLRQGAEQHLQAGDRRPVGLHEAAPVHALHDHDGVLRVGDAADEVLLHLAELRGPILADGRGLLQRLCVLGDLDLQVLDRRGELPDAGAAALDLALQLLGPDVRVGDRLRLLLLVGVAPADHLVVHVCLRGLLVLQLRPHLAQQVDHALDRRLLLQVAGPLLLQGPLPRLHPLLEAGGPRARGGEGQRQERCEGPTLHGGRWAGLGLRWG
mmetsp:Transcript_21893/g.69104  ORF Transcript_21893/g.69104 Transcript_21893/m.69104 type:complete len:262 (+) Transcript_21893:799-1584(+)